MFEKHLLDDEIQSVMTPQCQSGSFVHQDMESDQDIIILNDDDFIQATFNLINAGTSNSQLYNNTTNTNNNNNADFVNEFNQQEVDFKQQNEFKPSTFYADSSLQQSACLRLIDLIDLTTCDDFDLNDLFQIQDSNTPANLSLNQPEMCSPLHSVEVASSLDSDCRQDQKLIKNEFDFKMFNPVIANRQQDFIEEITIDDDDDNDDFDEACDDKYSQLSLSLPSLSSENDRSFSSANSYQCAVCSKTFNKTYNFKRHLLQHESQKQLYECPNCSRKILDKSNFSKHLKLCFKPDMPPPQMIAPLKTVPNRSNANCPLRKQPNEFNCNICGKEFKKKFNFVRHLKVHSLHKQMNDNQVQPHLSHLKEDFYQCDQCKRCFVEEKQLHAHMKTWHQAGILCKYCFCSDNLEVRFNEKFDYIKHLNTVHSFNFGFECRHCRKNFRFFSHYQEHRKLHEEVCTSNLSFQKDFSANLKPVFSGDMLVKPTLDYNSSLLVSKCEICGKKFAKMHNFKRHLEIHCSKIKLND